MACVLADLKIGRDGAGGWQRKPDIVYAHFTVPVIADRLKNDLDAFRPVQDI